MTPSAEFRENTRGLLTEKVIDEQIDAAWSSFPVDILRPKLGMLLKLREKYVVYLLSNINEIHWKRAYEHVFPYRGFRVEDYFEKMYLSYEVKMMKPVGEISQRILEDVNLDPHGTFSIDDSETNYQGAQALGISTYMVKSSEDWRPFFVRDK